MKRVLFSFGKYGALALLAKGRLVYASMNGNKYFTTPAIAMPDLLEMLDTMDSGITAAKNGGREAKAIKNQLVADMKIIMRTQAMYVNSVANGSVPILVSSGFTLEKDRSPVALGTPAFISLQQGQNPGEMEARVECDGFKSFVYQYAVDNGDENLSWQFLPSIKTRFVYTGLAQGKKYWFRVVASGSKDQQTISNEITQYVLQRSIK